MTKPDVARAAQNAEAAGPQPGTPQHHRWGTPDEYAAQIAMPTHLIGEGLFPDHENLPRYATLCGVLVGTQMLRTTDIPDDVTCPRCKRKRTLAKKAKK